MSGKGGLYVWRVRKPHALLGWPIIGRRTGYVGMTNSYYHRASQHLGGSVKYGKLPASWSDLDPKCYHIPLSNFILHGHYRRKITFLLETLLIALLCPAYNVTQQPPWNLRKVSARAAAAQRAARDSYGRGYVFMRAVLRWIINLSVITVLVGSWVVTR